MFENFNHTLFELTNNLSKRNVVLDYIGIFFAKYLVFVFVLYPVFLWFKKDDQNKNIALYTIYSAILGLLFNLLISKFYFYPRPFTVIHTNLLIKHIADNSFPSDHTTFMLSIAFLIVYFNKTKFQGIILSVLGFLGGMARVFCGVHFPFDIFGSVLIALISSAIIYYLKDKLKFINKFIMDLYGRIVGNNG